jgi:hypothetical protein
MITASRLPGQADRKSMWTSPMLRKIRTGTVLVIVLASTVMLLIVYFFLLLFPDH